MSEFRTCSCQATRNRYRTRFHAGANDSADSNMQASFNALTQAQLLREQQKALLVVTEVTGLTDDDTARLLRHCRW